MEKEEQDALEVGEEAQEEDEKDPEEKGRRAVSAFL